MSAAQVLLVGSLAGSLGCDDQRPAPPAAATQPAVPVSVGASCDSCGNGPQACAPAAAEACYLLGVKYEAGDSVPKDPARARELWQRAAAAGNPRAQDKLKRAWGI